MRYTVWSTPVCQVFSTSLVSRASVFHLVITALTLIPPLLMAYRYTGVQMVQCAVYILLSVYRCTDSTVYSVHLTGPRASG